MKRCQRVSFPPSSTAIAAHGVDVAITLERQPWTTAAVLRTIRPVLRGLLGAEPPEAWNYHETLDLRLGRADSVVFLDTPWWICARRAFMRGIRRPPGFQPPDGCDDDPWQRLRDEWWLVWRIWRVRHSDRERELGILSQHGRHAPVHVLRSKRDVRQFLRTL